MQTELHIHCVDQRFATLGELGLGGASFSARAQPETDEVSVRLALTPVSWLEVPARVVACHSGPEGVRVRLAFSEMEVSDELALARWLDRHAGLANERPAPSAGEHDGRATTRPT